MAERISLLPAPVLICLLAAGALAAPLGVEKVATVETPVPEKTPGWYHYVNGAYRSDPWYSLWLFDGVGYGFANRFTFTHACTIKWVRTNFYNSPGYAVSGMNVEIRIYADDGAGRPGTELYTSGVLDVPEDLGWAHNYCYPDLYVSAGDYHFAFIPSEDSAAAMALVTSDTFDAVCPDPEDRGSFSTNGGITWHSNMDPLGWGGCCRWYICGEIIFGPVLADQVMIPSCLMGAPGRQVRMPFYGEVAGYAGEDLDGVTVTLHFGTECLEMLGCVYENVLFHRNLDKIGEENVAVPLSW